MPRPDFLPKVSKYKSNDRPAKQRKDGQVRGEACSYAKMTEEVVRRIKALKKPGVGVLKIQRALAKDGLSAPFYAIQAVIEGRTWRHV